MYSWATLLKEDLPLPLAQKKVFFILALARCLDIAVFWTEILVFTICTNLQSAIIQLVGNLQPLK